MLVLSDIVPSFFDPIFDLAARHDYCVSLSAPPDPQRKMALPLGELLEYIPEVSEKCRKSL